MGYNLLLGQTCLGAGGQHYLITNKQSNIACKVRYTQPVRTEQGFTRHNLSTRTITKLELLHLAARYFTLQARDIVNQRFCERLAKGVSEVEGPPPASLWALLLAVRAGAEKAKASPPFLTRWRAVCPSERDARTWQFRSGFSVDRQSSR